MYTLLELQTKTFGELKKIGQELNVLPKNDRRRRESWIDAIVGVNPPLLALLETSSTEDVQTQKLSIIETVEASPALDDVQAQEPPIESKFGRIVYPRPAQKAIVQSVETSPTSEVELAQGAIEQAAKNTPGVDSVEEPKCVECFDDGFIEEESGFIRHSQSCNEPKLSHQKTQSAIAPASKNLPGSRSKTTAHQLLKLFKSSSHILEDSPAVKIEATVSESAIVPVAKNRIEEGSDQNPILSDQNPILTGNPLSDRFVTRYTPPQPGIIHFQSDADGQLSLLDFEVESVDEPPDPDDYESLDAFREAIARWDLEHPTSSFDHCSDLLPSSVQNEPSSVQNELPLQVSLDSFCLWAHCPDDWYEPAVLLEPSKVMEMSPVYKNSSTSDFFIPTFNGLGDRSNRNDEPPDTGIFARLPKPKPPTFPPQASQPKSGQVSPSQPKSAQVSPSQPGIPKLLHRVVAGTSNQPARSPPGGDAM